MPEAEARALRRLAEQAGLDHATLLKQARRRGSAEVLFERACQAYRRGEVTLSRAAEIANLSLRELMLRLAAADIELSYGVDDLEADLEG